MKNSAHFGDVSIFRINNGIQVDYGPTKGWQRFATLSEALAHLDKWSDEELNSISKELAAMTKLRRFIKREAKGQPCTM